MPTHDPDFFKRLLATFRVEGEEHITAIGAGLVALEKAADGVHRTEIIETIFREAHSLKGAARAVNLGKVESLCQSLETVFARMKTQDTTLSPELFDQLHSMVSAAEKELAAAAQSSTPQEKEPSSLSIEITAKAPFETRSQQSLVDDKAGLPDTVRVSASKLDAILRQAEELISAKATAAHRLIQVREVMSVLAAWEKHWKKIRPQVRGLQHQDGRGGGSNGWTPGASGSVPGAASTVAFLDRNEQMLQSVTTQVTTLSALLDNDRRLFERRVGELLDDIKRVSMLPFATLLGVFPKLVRDLCRDCGKDADLTIEGGDIEASRRVLDEIKGPLIHLVRNCIDHGIESKAEREKSGKPPRATITIAITPKGGGRVELAVTDDGAGIDTDKVIATATKQGLVSGNEVPGKDDGAALDLIFHSGLSTSQMLTAISGRGLGLAIVREKVEALGGAVAVETQLGLGTTFRLTIPATIATFRGIVVRVGENLFVIPTMYVQRALRVSHESIKSVENRAAIELNGRTVSLVWLSEVLGQKSALSVSDARRKWPGVLLECAGERIVFLVDEVLHDQEVLVRDLGKQLVRVRNISGAAVLETGKVVPVFYVADLMRSAAGLTPVRSNPEAETKPKSILVAEDSITARTLLRGILESSGFSVSTAVNGAEAFNLLEGGNFDLLVSDVEMPRMSGFDLTAKVRANRRLADLPIVLVTALDSRDDRERGADVGANAYIVKSSFEQSNLLEVVQRLI